MADQPRIPAGDKRRGRIHPGEFTKPKGRTDKGKRGTKGTQLPKSAPIHDRKKTYPGRKDKSVRHDPEGSFLPEEMVGGFECRNCGWPGWREHRIVTREGVQHATLALQGCTNCGTMHPAHVGVAATANAANKARRVRKGERARLVDVAKSIDSSETAVTREDGPELVGHRTACPRGGSAPCGAEKAGRCTICDFQVQDHQAIGKTMATVLDLRKLAGL